MAGWGTSGHGGVCGLLARRVARGCWDAPRMPGCPAGAAGLVGRVLGDCDAGAREVLRGCPGSSLPEAAGMPRGCWGIPRGVPGACPRGIRAEASRGRPEAGPHACPRPASPFGRAFLRLPAARSQARGARSCGLAVRVPIARRRTFPRRGAVRSCGAASRRLPGAGGREGEGGEARGLLGRDAEQAQDGLGELVH